MTATARFAILTALPGLLALPGGDAGARDLSRAEREILIRSEAQQAARDEIRRGDPFGSRTFEVGPRSAPAPSPVQRPGSSGTMTVPNR